MDGQPRMNGFAGASEKQRNDSSKSWVVQKFGGTSVGKFAEEIVELVVK